ncbi:MAG: TRAP transporter small permease [Variibacter sp.]
MYHTVSRILAWIEKVLSIGAIVSIVAMMLIVAVDVALRYLFARPMSWTYDFITLYVGVFLFYFALPRTSAEGGHVAVDILQHAMSSRVRRGCEAITTLLAAILLACIAVAMYVRARDEFLSDNIIAGVIDWPTWPASAVACVGSATMAVRQAILAVAHVAGLISGREIAPLPLRSGSALETASTVE